MKPQALIFPLLATLLAITLSTAPAWSGTVYRWVDDEGNVQFSDNPPAGREAQDTGQRTRRDRPAQAAPASASEGDGKDAQEQEAQAADKPPELAPLTPEQKQELARQHKANCEAARAALQTMDNHARLRVEEDGEMRFLAPEEIQERRERMERIRDESCNWSPNDA